MRAHVLEQQLPIRDLQHQPDVTQQQPVVGTTCVCPHLLRWLPHAISLDQIHGKLKNPVHALHLQALLDDGSSTHFGPEQVRLQALQKAGLAESYCQLTGNSRKSDDPSDMFVIRQVTTKTPQVDTKHGRPVVASSSDVPSVSLSSAAVAGNPSEADEKLMQKQKQQQERADEQALAEFRKRESNILAQRQTFLGKRTIRKSSLKQSKRKTNPDISIDQIGWEEEASRAQSKVEGWMELYRRNRVKASQSRSNEAETMTPLFGQIDTGISLQASGNHSCLSCLRKTGKSPTGDSLLQCLDCGHVGCVPCSLDEHSKQHIIHHFLAKNHALGVTCGQRGIIYCFPCADIVYHTIFDMENERLEVEATLPHIAWPPHPVQRSMDAFQFVTLPEHGVVWNGIVASYPSVVPNHHRHMGKLMIKRHTLMRGAIQCKWGNLALQVGLHQYQNGGSTRLTAPVGLYNLGNTCFLNAVLQCLIHCAPLQDYFLKDIGHDTQSCQLLRAASASEQKSNICLACELDTLFLKYFGSVIGKEVVGALTEPNHPFQRFEQPSMSIEKGLPLVPSNLLTAAWKSGGMDHLAGYEQRDAHEFLQAFLDLVGKHTSAHHGRIQANLDMALPFGKAYIKRNDGDGDIVKLLFEGSLRSVSICDECGCKRSMSEVFLNVSLPLPKPTDASSRHEKGKISVERCLKQFTQPESLADPVDCPTCKTKTKTRKQQTFGHLPKILCLHLKRFDAAKNKKITDFVSFPARGLDLGPLLPQWSEVMQGKNDGYQVTDNQTSPLVNYDLFGTVNHTGSLSQGHYVANVKIGERWFYCNDAGVFDTCEDDVIKSDGAYVLFYTRR